MTEQELRMLLRHSPEKGQRKLFELYHRYVYTIVWQILGNIASREDTEEIVSDIFAEIFLHLDSVYEGSLKGYISTISRRTAIDAFRKFSRQKPNFSIDDETFQEIPDNINITQSFEDSEQARALLEAVLQLGEPDSQILIQKYYYNRNSSEIAQTLHMNPVAVRMRSSRALKRLRKILENSNEF
ncbi:MAG: sigma-70 family RNA polymerase sigma factor [Oscillospiraceae bacterium]|nr:sigma-70 family RNA polymerase sigma factor [Oscillospiraceae bacterium]